MKLSFVIPAHDEEKNIGACIEAILSEIARAGADAEIIVVNNASEDRTHEVAAAYAGVLVVDEPRKGLTRARQSGYEASHGDLIANIDADVLVPAGWLDIVTQRFQDPTLVALSGPFVYHDLPLMSRGLVRLFYAIGFTFSRIGHALYGRGAMLQGGNFVLRRDALARAGGFNTAIEFFGEDTEIAQRMAKQGRVVWTFSLWVNASGRRLKHEGVVRTGLRYAVNYFSVSYAGKPATKTYQDIRPH